MAVTDQVMDAGSGPSAYSQDLFGQLVALQQRSLAQSSRRQYDGSWQQWRRFCGTLGVPAWLPADSAATQSLLLALFAVHCWSGGLSHGKVSANSVRSKLSHVRLHHRLVLGFEPQLSHGHSLAIAGMQRLDPPPQPRAPVTTAMLLWLLRRLDLSRAQHRLIGGAALLGFFFLLRSAEYLAVRGQHKLYAIQADDVTVEDALGHATLSAACAHQVTVKSRGSKTDQSGRGEFRTLQRTGHRLLCPVVAVTWLLNHASSLKLPKNAPLCSLSRSKILSADAMARVIRSAARGTGADPTNFSCHSLRSGGATALLSSGVDSTVTMPHGRWRSEVFRRYTRYTRDTGANLAARMVTVNRGTRVNSSLEHQGAHAF